MATQTQTVPDEVTHKPIHVRTNPQVSGSMAPKSIPCPDPSVHNTKNTTLQEQASTAALYVTNPSRGTNVRDNYSLDADNKISSAGSVLHHSTTIFNFIDLTLCRSCCQPQIRPSPRPSELPCHWCRHSSLSRRSCNSSECK